MALWRIFPVQPGAEAVMTTLPFVDVLGNNVGIFEPKPFAKSSDADLVPFLKSMS